MTTRCFSGNGSHREGAVIQFSTPWFHFVAWNTGIFFSPAMRPARLLANSVISVRESYLNVGAARRFH